MVGEQKEGKTQKYEIYQQKYMKKFIFILYVWKLSLRDNDKKGEFLKEIVHYLKMI